jgi:UV DNA damage repair endonuclease
MFNQDVQRIGWACKYMHPDQSQTKRVLEELQRPYNTKTTTVQWLNRQTRSVAEQRLWDIMVHNIQSYANLVEYAGAQIPANRMVRLGSDCLPVYTHPQWSYFWKQPDVVAYCETEFSKVGARARELDVRLSMHPGQFCVLASESDDVVDRSIEEFEYHVDMIRWMGYGKAFQDFKCNVHISGRRGPQGIIAALSRLSPEARNTITIENDENSWGVDASLELADHVALVLDIHHAWVNEGVYIQPTDDRVKRMIDSWRGVRSVIHYSYSRDEHLPEGFKHNSMPDMQRLLEDGHKKAKLRAHSDRYPNSSVNDWALSFWEYSDIMAEVKYKNLASIELYNYAVKPSDCR